MLVAWQPNSLASSLGARPARTSSIICSRNCAEYGGLGVCGLDTLDSFCKNNKVSVKWGQLHFTDPALFKQKMSDWLVFYNTELPHLLTKN